MSFTATDLVKYAVIVLKQNGYGSVINPKTKQLTALNFSLAEVVADSDNSCAFALRDVSGGLYFGKVFKPSQANSPEREVVALKCLVPVEEVPTLVAAYDDVVLMSYAAKEINGREVRAVPLRDLITSLGRCDSVNIFRKLLAAMEKVHGCGVIHNDVSESNILVCPDNSVFVGDLGASKLVENVYDNHPAGTSHIMHPSRLMGESSERTDVHSLSFLFYEMLVKGFLQIPMEPKEYSELPLEEKREILAGHWDRSIRTIVEYTAVPQYWRDVVINSTFFGMQHRTVSSLRTVVEQTALEETLGLF